MPATLPSPFASGARQRSPHVPAAARLLLMLMSRIDRGRIELRAPDGSVHRFGPGGAAAPGIADDPAVMELANWRVAAASLKGGDVGFAESHIAGAPLSEAAATRQSASSITAGTSAMPGAAAPPGPKRWTLPSGARSSMRPRRSATAASAAAAAGGNVRRARRGPRANGEGRVVGIIACAPRGAARAW